MPLDPAEISSWDKRKAREAAAKLFAEPPKGVTDEFLDDDGRYFSETCQDLAQCSHGDTGEYGARADGKVIAALWNAWQCGLLCLKSEKENP